MSTRPAAKRKIHKTRRPFDITRVHETKMKEIFFSVPFCSCNIVANEMQAVYFNETKKYRKRKTRRISSLRLPFQKNSYTCWLVASVMGTLSDVLRVDFIHWTSTSFSAKLELSFTDPHWWTPPYWLLHSGQSSSLNASWICEISSQDWHSSPELFQTPPMITISLCSCNFSPRFEAITPSRNPFESSRRCCVWWIVDLMRDRFRIRRARHELNVPLSAQQVINLRWKR